MSITVSSGSEYTPVEPGVYPAQCVGLIDLGLQTNTFEGETKTAAKIVLYFDLFQDTDQYFCGFYTASLAPRSNLRAHLEGWRGKSFTQDELKGFELDALVGKPCTLTIGLTTTGNPKISSISKAMKNVNLESNVTPFIVPLGGIGTDQPEIVGEGMWRLMLEGATRAQEAQGKAAIAKANDTLEDDLASVPF